MKDKSISRKKYSATLFATWFIVTAVIYAIFFGGVYAIAKIFSLPSWAMWIIFGAVILVWVTNGIRRNHKAG